MNVVLVDLYIIGCFNSHWQLELITSSLLLPSLILLNIYIYPNNFSLLFSFHYLVASIGFIMVSVLWWFIQHSMLVLCLYDTWKYYFFDLNLKHRLLFSCLKILKYFQNLLWCVALYSTLKPHLTLKPRFTFESVALHSIHLCSI